jgi:hypothetical protein
MIESPTKSGTVVLCQIQAGTDGHDYDVVFEATSAAGDKWQRDVHLSVRA